MPKKRQLIEATITPTYPARICSTTEGRQVFPDILQEGVGDKGITVFIRSGRCIGAVVPMEYIRMLAGESLDETVELRIKNTAQNLLRGFTE